MRLSFYKLNKVIIIRNILLHLFCCSFCCYNKGKKENKCGGGTTLTSNSVAQKVAKFKILVCATLTLSLIKALKLNKF